MDPRRHGHLPDREADLDAELDLICRRLDLFDPGRVLCGSGRADVSSLDLSSRRGGDELHHDVLHGRVEPWLVSSHAENPFWLWNLRVAGQPLRAVFGASVGARGHVSGLLLVVPAAHLYSHLSGGCKLGWPLPAGHRTIRPCPSSSHAFAESTAFRSASPVAKLCSRCAIRKDLRSRSWCPILPPCWRP